MNPKYMEQAIALARKGMGHTAPNPMVGCVVVKNEQVIAMGYHERIGGLHAERNALTNCTEDTEGAELYVTLEPCCHYGKTPPCTKIILEKKIAKVYVGSMDPNPLVAGKGVQILRDHGVQVICGVLQEECDQLNEVFFHYILKKTPFVAMKYAMTLDGKIACENGDSKWVTGEAAREKVQQMRKQYSGIMAGIGTVLADDPLLNCRIEEGVDPVRIICDSALRIPLDSQIVKTAGNIRTLVVYTAKAEKRLGDKLSEQKMQLVKLGVELIKQNNTDEVDLQELMQTLGQMGLDSILLEGGGTLNAAALQAGIVNRIHCFIAPKVVGGAQAKSPIEGRGLLRMRDANILSQITVDKIGDDILISGKVEPRDDILSGGKEEAGGTLCSQEL